MRIVNDSYIVSPYKSFITPNVFRLFYEGKKLDYWVSIKKHILFEKIMQCSLFLHNDWTSILHCTYTKWSSHSFCYHLRFLYLETVIFTLSNLPLLSERYDDDEITIIHANLSATTTHGAALNPGMREFLKCVKFCKPLTLTINVNMNSLI